MEESYFPCNVTRQLLKINCVTIQNGQAALHLIVYLSRLCPRRDHVAEMYVSLKDSEREEEEGAEEEEEGLRRCVDFHENKQLLLL